MDMKFFHVEKNDSDQTGWIHRLSGVFAGHICQKVHFLTLWFVFGSAILLTLNIGIDRPGQTADPDQRLQKEISSSSVLDTSTDTPQPLNTLLLQSKAKPYLLNKLVVSKQKCIDYIETLSYMVIFL